MRAIYGFENYPNAILETRYGKVRAIAQDADTVYLATDPRGYPHSAYVGDAEDGRDAGLTFPHPTHGEQLLYCNVHGKRNPISGEWTSSGPYASVKVIPTRGFVAGDMTPAAHRKVIAELLAAAASWATPEILDAAGEAARSSRVASAREDGAKHRRRAEAYEALALAHEQGEVDRDTYYEQHRALYDGRV